MRTRLSRSIALFVLVALISLTLASCSRKEDQNPSTPRVGSVFNNLPEDTLAFFVADMTDSGYRNFLKNPSYQAYWKGYRDMTTHFPELTSMKSYLDILQNLGFMGSSPDDAPPFSEAVAFMKFENAGQGASPVQLGYFLSALPGKPANQTLGKIKSILTAAKLQVKDQSFGTAAGFSIEPIPAGENAQPANPPSPQDLVMGIYRPLLEGQKVFFAATEERLAVSNSEILANALFVKGDGAYRARLDASPSYSDDMKALGEFQSGPFHGYVDAAKILDSAPSISPTLAAMVQQVRMFAPVQSVTFGFTFDAAMLGKTAIRTLPLMPMAQEWVDRLSDQGAHPSFQQLPSGGLFNLSLSGAALEKFKEGLLGMAPVPQEMKDQLAAIHVSGDIAVSVRAGDGEKAMPEGCAIISGASPELAALVNSMVGPMLSGGNPPSKLTVKERQVVVFQSPGAPGLFMTADGDPLVIASTQTGLETALGATKETSFTARLPKNLNSFTSNFKGPLLMGINYGGLFDALGKFTDTMGSSPQQDYMKANLELMKKMGIIVVALGYQKPYLAIDMGQAYPE